MKNDPLFDMKRFEQNFDLTEKRVNWGIRIVFFLWVMWVLFCLSLLGGAIYVAIHFISKYW